MRLPTLVEERNAFAGVVQIAAEPADGIHARIKRLPRVRVGVVAENDARAARQVVPSLNMKLMPSKYIPLNSRPHRRCFAARRIRRANRRWVVHDFRDAQRNPERANGERGFGDRAPVAAGEGAGADGDGVVQRDGPV
jgi:hypothetical protein